MGIELSEVMLENGITGFALARIGTTEIILLLVLALLIFGGSKLSGLGKALGTSIRDFKKETSGLSEKPETEPEQEEKTAKTEIENEKEESPNA